MVKTRDDFKRDIAHMFMEDDQLCEVMKVLDKVEDCVIPYIYDSICTRHESGKFESLSDCMNDMESKNLLDFEPYIDYSGNIHLGFMKYISLNAGKLFYTSSVFDLYDNVIEGARISKMCAFMMSLYSFAEVMEYSDKCYELLKNYADLIVEFMRKSSLCSDFIDQFSDLDAEELVVRQPIDDIREIVCDSYRVFLNTHYLDVNQGGMSSYYNTSLSDKLARISMFLNGYRYEEKSGRFVKFIDCKEEKHESKIASLCLLQHRP